MRTRYTGGVADLCFCYLSATSSSSSSSLLTKPVNYAVDRFGFGGSRAESDLLFACDRDEVIV